MAANDCEGDELGVVAVRVVHSGPGKCKLRKRVVGDLVGAGFEVSCRTLQR